MTDEPPEIEELERTAAWRFPGWSTPIRVDTAKGAAAAVVLEALAGDLRQNDYAAMWTELRSIGNWLGEVRTPFPTMPIWRTTTGYGSGSRRIRRTAPITCGDCWPSRMASCNERPRFDGSDPAIRTRLKIL